MGHCYTCMHLEFACNANSGIWPLDNNSLLLATLSSQCGSHLHQCVCTMSEAMAEK